MSVNALYMKVMEGDRDAEQRLYEHLSVSFLLFAQQRVYNDQDAQEIVQDALMTIVQKYKTIKIEVSFAAWAYRVLNFKIMDYIKAKMSRAKKMKHLSMRGEGIEPWVPEPDLQSRLKECFGKIHHRAVRHARILNLHYQGYSTSEICTRLGITTNNMYVILSRVRRMLGLCLETGDID